jgi:hypothetical protein
MDGWSNVEDDLDLDLDIPQMSVLRPDTTVTSVPDGWVVDHEELDLDLDENVLSKDVNMNVSESKQKESVFESKEVNTNVSESKEKESYIQSEADGWGFDINIVDTNDIVQTKYQHVQELSSAVAVAAAAAGGGGGGGGDSSGAPIVAVINNSPIVTNNANVVMDSHLPVLESMNGINIDTVTSPIFEKELSRIKDSDKEEEEEEAIKQYALAAALAAEAEGKIVSAATAFIDNHFVFRQETNGSLKMITEKVTLALSGSFNNSATAAALVASNILAKKTTQTVSNTNFPLQVVPTQQADIITHGDGGGGGDGEESSSLDGHDGWGNEDNLVLDEINTTYDEEDVRRLAEIETQRLAEIESRQLAEIESQRLAEIESQRLAEIESRRLAEIESQRLAEIETQRLAEIEARQLAEIESRQLAEIESQRLAEIETQRLAEIETQRLAEIESQRLAEIESQRLAEIESRRLAEIEAQRLAEIEAQRLAEIESQRLADIEAQRLAEIESQRLAEIESRRLAEIEARRLAEIEAERLAEIEARRLAEIEAQRLAEIESQRLADIEAQRQAEIETQRLAEIESQRLAEIESRRLAEIEAERLAEAQRLAEEEEARERLRKELVAAEEAEAAEQAAAEEAHARLVMEAESAKRKAIESWEAQEQLHQAHLSAQKAAVEAEARVHAAALLSKAAEDERLRRAAEARIELLQKEEEARVAVEAAKKRKEEEDSESAERWWAQKVEAQKAAALSAAALSAAEKARQLADELAMKERLAREEQEQLAQAAEKERKRLQEQALVAALLHEESLKRQREEEEEARKAMLVAAAAAALAAERAAKIAAEEEEKNRKLKAALEQAIEAKKARTAAQLAAKKRLAELAQEEEERIKAKNNHLFVATTTILSTTAVSSVTPTALSTTMDQSEVEKVSNNQQIKYNVLDNGPIVNEIKNETKVQEEREEEDEEDSSRATIPTKETSTVSIMKYQETVIIKESQDGPFEMSLKTEIDTSTSIDGSNSSIQLGKETTQSTTFIDCNTNIIGTLSNLDDNFTSDRTDTFDDILSKRKDDDDEIRQETLSLITITDATREKVESCLVPQLLSSNENIDIISTTATSFDPFNSALVEEDDEFEAALARDSAAFEAKLESERREAEAAEIAIKEELEMKLVDASTKILDAYTTVRSFFSNELNKAIQYVNDTAQRELDRTNALIQEEADRLAAEQEALRLKEKLERERVAKEKETTASGLVDILDTYIIKRSGFNLSVAEAEKRRITEEALQIAASEERKTREIEEERKIKEAKKLATLSTSVVINSALSTPAILISSKSELLTNEKEEEEEHETLLESNLNEHLYDHHTNQNDSTKDDENNDEKVTKNTIIPLPYLTPSHSAAVGLVKTLQSALNAHIRSLLSPAGLAAAATTTTTTSTTSTTTTSTTSTSDSNLENNEELPVMIPFGALFPSVHLVQGNIYLPKNIGNSLESYETTSSSSLSTASSSLLSFHDPNEFIDLLFSFIQNVTRIDGVIDQALSGRLSGFAGAVITFESMSFALGLNQQQQSLASFTSFKASKRFIKSSKRFIKSLILETVCSQVCKALGPALIALSQNASSNPSWAFIDDNEDEESEGEDDDEEKEKENESGTNTHKNDEKGQKRKNEKDGEDEDEEDESTAPRLATVFSSPGPTPHKRKNNNIDSTPYSQTKSKDNKKDTISTTTTSSPSRGSREWMLQSLSEPAKLLLYILRAAGEIDTVLEMTLEEENEMEKYKNDTQDIKEDISIDTEAIPSLRTMLYSLLSAHSGLFAATQRSSAWAVWVRGQCFDNIISSILAPTNVTTSQLSPTTNTTTRISAIEARVSDALLPLRLHFLREASTTQTIPRDLFAKCVAVPILSVLALGSAAAACEAVQQSARDLKIASRGGFTSLSSHFDAENKQKSKSSTVANAAAAVFGSSKDHSELLKLIRPFLLDQLRDAVPLLDLDWSKIEDRVVDVSAIRGALGVDAMLNSEAIDQSHWNDLWESLRTHVKPLDTRCLLACSNGNTSSAALTLRVLRRAAQVITVAESSIDSLLLREGLVNAEVEDENNHEAVKNEETLTSSFLHTNHTEHCISYALGPLHIRLQRLSCLTEAFRRAEARALSAVFVSSAQPWFFSLSKNNNSISVSHEGGAAAFGEALWHLSALFTYLREEENPQEEDFSLACRVTNIIDSLAIQSILSTRGNSMHSHLGQMSKKGSESNSSFSSSSTSFKHEISLKKLQEQLYLISESLGISLNSDEYVGSIVTQAQLLFLLFPACGELVSLSTLPQSKIKTLVDALSSLLNGKSSGSKSKNRNLDQDETMINNKEVDEEGTIGTELVSQFLHMSKSLSMENKNKTKNGKESENDSEEDNSFFNSLLQTITSVSVASISNTRGLLGALSEREQLNTLIMILLQEKH